MVKRVLRSCRKNRHVKVREKREHEREKTKIEEIENV